MVGEGVLSTMKDVRIINYQHRFVGIKRQSDFYRKAIGIGKSNLTTATTTNTVSMKLERQRRTQNVEGDFFVDHKCIDCDTCRWMAPQVFTRVDEQSAVYKQPSTEKERLNALQALLSCPTSSIHTEKPARDILEVQKTFPLRINEQRIPVEDNTADVEIKLDGDGPWNLGNDFELIHTPGHTRGSVCLLYKPLKVLFAGDHISKDQSELSMGEQYNQQSVPLQLESVRKLLDFEFEWILPGHGRRVEFKDTQEKNKALKAFLVMKGQAQTSLFND
ncbi:hypothetical protein MKX03_022645 [Papaver bracteatum]|nr:hypothetical protein MKX03_022645 [Papaver bracteatum]